MTPKQLAALPLDTLVTLGGDTGKIVKAGQTVYIEWSDPECTNIIDTNSKAWESYISQIEEKT